MLRANALKTVAKTAIFNEDGKILALVRSDTDPTRPGGLDFPGGEIEEGEDILAGACREMQEEVGISLQPTDIRLIYTNATDKSSGESAVLRFLCVANVDNPQIELSFEHSSYVWMTVEEVLEKFRSVSWAQGLKFAIKNEIFTNHLQ